MIIFQLALAAIKYWHKLDQRSLIKFIQKYAKVVSDSEGEELIEEEGVMVSDRELINDVSIFQGQNQNYMGIFENSEYKRNNYKQKLNNPCEYFHCLVP